MYGDDMDEFITTYSEHFRVDVSAYLWYFHTGEEGFMPIGLFLVRAPNQRVAKIPISIEMLHRFAVLRHWALEYPPHRPPKAALRTGWFQLFSSVSFCWR